MESLEQAEQELISLKPHPFMFHSENGHPLLRVPFQDFPIDTGFLAVRGHVSGPLLRGVSVQRIITPSEGARPYKLAPSFFHPARRALQAVGSSMVTQEPTLCILGDAALAHGEFFQALNLLGSTTMSRCLLVIRFPIDENAPIALQQVAQSLTLLVHIKSLYIYAEPTTEAIEAAVQAASNRLLSTLIETTLEK